MPKRKYCTLAVLYYRPAKCLLFHFWVFLQKLCSDQKAIFSERWQIHIPCNRLVFEPWIMPDIKLFMCTCLMARSLSNITLIFCQFSLQQYILFQENHCNLSSLNRKEQVRAWFLFKHFWPMCVFPLMQNQAVVFHIFLHIKPCLCHSPKCQFWALFGCNLLFLWARRIPGMSV